MTITEVSELQKLREYLESKPPGYIADVSDLEGLLSACWHELDGSDEEGMSGYKLHNRMEKVKWSPPVLTFTMERHGATALGSTRAELQGWDVNIDTKVAEYYRGGFRQLYPMQPRLNVKPIAEEIASLVVNRQQDDRLKWRSDGSVRVDIGKILPADSACKQTLEGRRKRFRDAMVQRMHESGWRRVRANVYKQQ